MSSRLREIYRRWPRNRWTRQSRRLWQELRLEDYAPAMGMFLGVVLAFQLEFVLWMDKGFEIWLFARPLRTTLGQGGFLGIFLINTWLLDRFLTAMDFDGVARRYLVPRRLASAVPLLRLALIPLWRGVRRLGAGQQASPPPVLDLEGRPSRWRTMFVGRPFFVTLWSELFFLWLFASEVTLAFALTGRLADPEVYTPESRSAVLTVTVLLHLVAAGSMLVVLAGREDERRPSVFYRGVLWLTAFFLLFPFPVSCLGVFSWVLAEHSDHRTKTLMASVYRHSGSVARLPRWHSLEQSLRGDSADTWWGLWWKSLGLVRPADEGEAEAQCRALYRLKTLALFFETGGLAMVLGSIQQDLISGPVHILSSLVAVGLLTILLSFIVRLTKTPRRFREHARLPYGRYLALTQASCLAGWFTGTAADAPTLAWILLTVGLAGVISLTLFTIAMIYSGLSRRSEPVIALWFIFFIAVGVLGGSAVHPEVDPGMAETVLAGLRGAFGFAAFLGLPLVFMVGWLLRPCHGRQILDREIPWQRRLVLAALVLGVALPGGGLTIPLWIYLRTLN